MVYHILVPYQLPYEMSLICIHLIVGLPRRHSPTTCVFMYVCMCMVWGTRKTHHCHTELELKVLEGRRGEKYIWICSGIGQIQLVSSSPKWGSGQSKGEKKETGMGGKGCLNS